MNNNEKNPGTSRAEEGEEHLGDDIKRRIREVEVGFRTSASPDRLAVGHRLLITTQSRTYVLERREDGLYMSGNPSIARCLRKIL